MRRYYCFAQFPAIFFGFTALTLPGSHSQAQSPEPSTAAHAPTLTVSSRLVVLDVVVTGKDGKPVDGLTRNDFRVYEDNQFEPIRTFEPPSAHTLPAASDDPATVFDPANPKPFGQSPVTVLVLDQLNTHFTDSSFARRELRDYLSGQPALLKQPTTLLTVYDNRFKQLQGFTRNRDVLLKALADAPTKAAWYLEVGGNSDTDSGPVERLQQSLNALVQMSQSFARIPGRKNMIWVGGGFPTLNPTTLDGDHAQEVKDTIQHVTDVLLETHITMYAIDPTSNAAGLTEITNVDQTDFVTAGGGIMGISIDPFDSAEDFDRLAPVTGGRIVRGLNDVGKQIATSIELGANFYTLGYVPGSDSNLASKFRKIRVECLRPGVTVNTREGYYPGHSESPAAVRTDLSYDLSTAADSSVPLNGLRVAVQPAAAPAAYILHVAAADLTWTANDDGTSTAHVAVLAVARSAKEKMLGHTLREMTATARAGTNLRDPARQADFQLTPSTFAKTASLRFVVRDAASGRMGSADLTPAAP